MANILNAARPEVYHLIQMHPLNVSPREISQLFDRSRMDPRLMEILTEYLRDFWWTLDPIALNKAVKKARFPFVMKAALILILEHCEILESEKLEFIGWFQKAVSGIKNPAPQLLYVGVFPIGSKTLQHQVEGALPSLLGFNLILKDLPFNKGKPGVLKGKTQIPQNRINELDLLKVKYVQKIKDFKNKNQLTNEQLIKLSGINRVFLSRIMNNKVEKISIEYLKKKLEHLNLSA